MYLLGKRIKSPNMSGFSIIKIDKQSIEIASAGMPPVYIYYASENRTEEILIGGLPLGAMPAFSYQTEIKDLHPGDTLLMLTDGLAEQQNREDRLYGYDRIRDLFTSNADKPAEKIIDILIGDVTSWQGDRPQEDDISLLVLKAK